MWMCWVWRFWIIGLSLVLDRWVSNCRSLWFCVSIVGLLLKIDWWVCVCICVCFLADFWVCVFFFVFGWREIFCCVCVCVLAGDRFMFLCLANKRDLLLGLCLCSCWRSVCVLCSWICVLVGSVFLCLCSCLLCFVFLDLCSCCFCSCCSWIWIRI